MSGQRLAAKTVSIMLIHSSVFSHALINVRVALTYVGGSVITIVQYVYSSRHSLYCRKKKMYIFYHFGT